MNENQTPTDNTRDELAPETDMPDNTYPAAEESSSKHGVLGPVVGILVIVLILILGGLYLWGDNLDRNSTDTTPATQEEQTQPEAMEDDSTMSSSDSIEAIEADLEDSDFEDLDAELDELDAEMEASMESGQ